MRTIFLITFLITLLASIQASAFSVKGPVETKLGVRFQGVVRQQEIESHGGIKTTEQDMYLRRARLEYHLDWGNGFEQSLDIRNDNINLEDRGMGNFRLGDAYIKKVLERGSFKHDFRVFKAKVDISRSQTVSSADLIYLNRPQSSVFASSYISQNRRANNLQWNGTYKDKLAWHLVIGDGTQSEAFEDALGNSVDSISERRFIYGGKVRYYLLGKKQKKISEGFFADENLISLGLGFFHQPSIVFMKGGVLGHGDRNLLNAEFTMHLGDFRLMGEYFSFSRVHSDFSSSLLNHGRGQAYYLQSEYFLNKTWSSFVRYEKWDRIRSIRALRLKNYVLGLNHYVDRNRLKFGFYIDHTENGSRILSEKQVTSVMLTTMIHYK